jgi:hypothetical protein
MPLKVLDILQVDDVEDEVLLIKKLTAILQLRQIAEHLTILICEEVKNGKAKGTEEGKQA